jgi:large subunit ribosomal protein L1
MSSKRHKENMAVVDDGKLYDLNEAVQVLKSSRKVKFDESVELSIKLGIDPKKSDQNVRGAVVLPHGTGKSARVIVFAEGPAADEATEAGALEVGGEALAKKVMDGWFDFDVAIATPASMRFVGKLGRTLGPKGLMPSPKAGTVTDKVGPAVKEYQAGKVEFRSDDGGSVRAAIAKLSFDVEKIVENIKAFREHLEGLKPSSAKGTFIRKIDISTTMGPGLSIAGEWS